MPDLFLNARIDTYWLADGNLDATLTRAEQYQHAGADGIFIPGVTEDDDISTIVSAVPAPVNVLYLPGRQPISQLAALGVSRISTGSLLFRTAMQAVTDTARTIRDDSPIGLQNDVAEPAQPKLSEAGPHTTGPRWVARSSHRGGFGGLGPPK